MLKSSAPSVRVMMNHELFDEVKLPPHDLGAEEAVLGSLLIDPEAIYGVVGWLKAEDFYREKNRWVYECCIDVNHRGEPINQIVVAHELAKKGQLESAGSADFLSHLVSQTPTSVHVEYYGKLVRNLARNRRLISAANQVAALGYEAGDVDESLLKAQEILDRIGDHRSTAKLISPEQWQEMAKERYCNLSVTGGAKMRFGFPTLDKHLGGAHPGQLILVGGRPGIGKTTILKQFCDKMVGLGIVLLASAEEGTEQLTDRYISGQTGLTMVQLAGGDYDEERLRSIDEATLDMLYSVPYLHVDHFMTVMGLRSVARQMKMRHGLDAIFVDYLQLLQDEYGKNSNERVSFISRSLKGLATSLGIPVIAACQLNRETERGNRKPQLHELRDSGSLEQDSDLVLFLYRKDAYPDCPDEKKGKAQLLVAKSRQAGYLRNHAVELVWLGDRYGEEVPN